MTASSTFAADAPQDASAPAGGRGPESTPASSQQDEVKSLKEELRRLKLEMGLGDVEYKSYAGMGPAASKVYYAPKGLSIGGYGEAFYRDQLGERGAGEDESDLLRVVLYAGYRFSEKILFNAEIEFEHAGAEIGVEFAYLDFLLSKPVRLRVGNVLVPMGFINEMHEPPFFHGVARPFTETNIIPATWHENGGGLHGDVGALRYKAYLLVGLDPLSSLGSDERVSSSEWLRRARTGGSEARSETFAGVLNLTYDLGPAVVSGSIYRGRSGQDRTVSDTDPREIDGEVTLGEVHAGLTWKGAQLRVLYALGRLGDADLISDAFGLSGTDVIGSRVQGGYAEVAYDLLTLLAPGGASSLSPFVRYERLNLHDQVPAGGTPDPALDQTFWTAGLTFKPVPTVVIKADYQRMDNQADDFSNRLSVGAGFVF